MINSVIGDLQPIIMTAFIGVIIAYARYVHNLKERVAVLERTIEDLMKTIESIQKRQDSQSRKQDDILDRIAVMEKEVLREMGSVKSEMSGMASDLKGLSNLILASDNGLKIQRQTHG